MGPAETLPAIPRLGVTYPVCQGSLDRLYQFEGEESDVALADTIVEAADLYVVGWAFDSEERSLAERAWLRLDSTLYPLAVRRRRNDVFRSVRGMPRAVGVGGVVPELAIPTGLRTAELLVAFPGEQYRRVRPQRLLRVIAPEQADPGASGSVDAAIRFFAFSDLAAQGPTHGRGRRSVRPPAPLRLHGWVLTSRAVRSVWAKVQGARYAAWFRAGPASRPPEHPAATGFDIVLPTTNWAAGLYELELAVDVGEGCFAARRRFGFDVVGDHPLQDAGLPEMHTPHTGQIDVLAADDMTTAAADDLRVVPAEPLAIRGWSLDTGAAAPGTAFFAVVDDERPVPIGYGLGSSAVDDTVNPALSVGGIVDTSRLNPGPHRLELRLISANGQGYYIAKSTTFTVIGAAEARARFEGAVSGARSLP